MAKYYLDYTVTRSVSECETEIIEAKSLSQAKKKLKDALKEDFSGEKIKVKYNDAYRTSEDARL